MKEAEACYTRRKAQGGADENQKEGTLQTAKKWCGHSPLLESLFGVSAT